MGYDILNEKGHSELEFMLMYLHKKFDIKFGYVLVNLGGILLIFLKPAEVFYILNQLTESSWKTFD